MTKILLTGSTGMLGNYVAILLGQSGYELITPTRQVCDLSDPAYVYAYVKQHRADIILHIGAETDVDLCERNPSRAGLCNHLSTASIARAAQENSSYLIYISTCFVFGAGGQMIHNELDLPDPSNYYGRSKLFGEQAVQGWHPYNHHIIRAGWMIGGGLKRDNKFVGKIVKNIKAGANEILAVNDKYGSITRASELARYISDAIKVGSLGTIHFASEGLITRLDMAKVIAKSLDFKGEVKGVSHTHFPLSAPRSKSDGITSLYLNQSANMTKSSDWKEDLTAYLTEFQ